MIHDQRIRRLNSRAARKGSYLLYWMQASQRARYNHALEYAIRQARELQLPVVAFFGIDGHYPDASERHYVFMLEGLREAGIELAEKGIQLVLRIVPPSEGVIQMAAHAALVVTDRGYLRHQKQWRERAAREIDCPLIEIESDVIVPVETASGREEYSAATFRPRIREKLPYFLVPLDHDSPARSSLGLSFPSLNYGDTDDILKQMGMSAVFSRPGGLSKAEELLDRFIEDRLSLYHVQKNDPSLAGLSELSPYIHFGQISPLHIALRIMEHRGPGADAFLEELVIRRELAVNFVHYNEAYDSPGCLPSWAWKTLDMHRGDEREYLYTTEELRNSRTHDRYWNAAQYQMVATGTMHGYMRMYWGKKIMEWTGTPEEAFRKALDFNNRYELDGRDPNGFAGIAWCFGKHDRPWKERAVFGMIRYMNARGLERKFDMKAYVKRTGFIGQ